MVVATLTLNVAGESAVARKRCIAPRSSANSNDTTPRVTRSDPSISIAAVYALREPKSRLS